MLTRIIVAVIGIPLLLALIFFAPLWAFAIFVGAVSAGAAWELLRCVAPDSPGRFRIYAAVTAFVLPNTIPLARVDIIMNSIFTLLMPRISVRESVWLTIAVFLLIFVMFAEVVASYRRDTPIKLETVLQVMFAGMIMPLMLTALVRVGMRDNAPVYLLLPFVAAFSSDSGGYFVGKFFGKHKAFPNLSPNKTVEGCVGGLLAAVVLMLLYGFVLTRLDYSVNYLYLTLYGIFGSVACQLGDLVFSAIKRQYGIKDYGTLIPGHGGVLDRFDSLHFTAPMIELLVLFLPAITR